MAINKFNLLYPRLLYLIPNHTLRRACRKIKALLFFHASTSLQRQYPLESCAIDCDPAAVWVEEPIFALMEGFPLLDINSISWWPARLYCYRVRGKTCWEILSVQISPGLFVKMFAWGTNAFGAIVYNRVSYILKQNTNSF